mmetsp:Transcript_35134/g.53875  ORF Transcript_35134/g.53875 Transcript_35134/m.53875 type:complete len:114 (+) Transcript_35134:794-1135(+)
MARQTIHMEVVLRQVQFEPSEVSYVLLIQNINGVISNHNSLMQSHYQEAITATISHEQMNPLNSIINLSRFLYERTKDQLGKEGSSNDSLNSSKSSNSISSLDRSLSSGDEAG